MKAMVFRLCYKKNSNKEQKDEFCGYRFQNVDDLLRQNKKYHEIWETLTIHATISINRERENKVEVTRITNANGLRRFMNPAHQLMNFLQKNYQVRIN